MPKQPKVQDISSCQIARGRTVGPALCRAHSSRAPERSVGRWGILRTVREQGRRLGKVPQRSRWRAARAGPWARLASTASPMPPRSSAAGQPLVSPCKQAPLCLSFRGACTGGLGRGRRGGAPGGSHWPQSFATRGCRRRARSDSEIKFQVGQLREISFSRPESFRLPPLQ